MTESEKQFVVSELVWIIGFIEGLKLGQSWPDAKPLSADDLTPIAERAKKIQEVIER